MNEKIIKLLKREEEINDRMSNICDVATALHRVSKTDRFPYFLTFARSIKKKENDLRSMRTKVRDQIKKEQDKCPHKYPDGQDAHVHYRGHDHNWSYYTCTFCNHEVGR